MVAVPSMPLAGTADGAVTDAYWAQLYSQAGALAGGGAGAFFPGAGGSLPLAAQPSVPQQTVAAPQHAAKGPKARKPRPYKPPDQVQAEKKKTQEVKVWEERRNKCPVLSFFSCAASDRCSCSAPQRVPQRRPPALPPPALQEYCRRLEQQLGRARAELEKLQQVTRGWLLCCRLWPLAELAALGCRMEQRGGPTNHGAAGPEPWASLARAAPRRRTRCFSARRWCCPSTPRSASARRRWWRSSRRWGAGWLAEVAWWKRQCRTHRR